MADREDEKCDICNRKVQKGLQCDACSCWYHNGCQGVPKDLFEILDKHESLVWFCKKCKPKILNKATKESKENEELKSINIKLLEKLEDLVKKIDDMQEEVNTLKQQLTHNGNGVNVTVNEEEIIQKTTKEVIEYLREEEDKNKRKPNLVMYNIPDANKIDDKEQVDEDLATCYDIIENSLGLRKDEYHVQEIVRLGKPRNERNNREENRPRNRPILVKLANEKEKWTVLKKARNLRDETDPVKKRVGIAPDLTKKEQEIERQMRQELNMRKAEGETGLYIKNGQILKWRGARERTY